MATPRIDRNDRRGSVASNAAAIAPKQVRNETGIEETKANETDYDMVLKYLIKSYDLYKKQSKADSLMQEGKVSALEDMRQLVLGGIKSRYLEKERKRKAFKDDETAMGKFSIEKIGPSYKELYTIYTLLDGQINKERDELVILKATERLMERMDSELENSLVELSMLEEVRSRATTVYPLDVKVRLDANLCGLKRPGGRKVFPCDEPPVEGTKYCKEHLKMHEPVLYSELFDPMTPTEGN